jgi:hypothetical protein
MRLPGFTAELSLGKTSQDYAARTIPASSEAGVIPQYWYCHGNYCCDEYGNCIYKGPHLM